MAVDALAKRPVPARRSAAILEVREQSQMPDVDARPQTCRSVVDRHARWDLTVDMHPGSAVRRRAGQVTLCAPPDLGVAVGSGRVSADVAPTRPHLPMAKGAFCNPLRDVQAQAGQNGGSSSGTDTIEGDGEDEPAKLLAPLVFGAPT